ncbi:MAG: hypothetical protein U0905_17845 [Pirellulales bacterium]
MEPIATYRESAPGLRRNFKLYSDHITVYAKTFGGDEKEVHIPLDELSARAGFVRFRVRRWFGGLFLSFILALFTWIFVSEFKLEWKSPRVVIASSLCLMSFGWGVYNLRRYRAYRFVNRSGIAVLDVIEHGPEKNQCANFVAFIEQAIRDKAGNSRNSEQSSSSQSSSQPFLND